MNAVVQENSPPTTSEIMARLFEIRRERKQLTAREKELIEEWSALEATLIARFEEQGSVRVTSTDGTASLVKDVYPMVEDWDAYWEFMKENDAPHLVQRRPAAGAYRELLSMKLQESGIDDLEKAIEEGVELPEVVPGTRPIIKKTISLRQDT